MKTLLSTIILCSTFFHITKCVTYEDAPSKTKAISNMQFGYTIIFVKNVEETLQFYQKAFSFKIKFFAESKLYGELDTGKTILAFCDESFCEKNGLSFNKNRPHTSPAGFEIGFIADDVDVAYKHAISQGAHPLKEPAVKPWGQRVAYVTDLNGIIIEICNAINY